MYVYISYVVASSYADWIQNPIILEYKGLNNVLQETMIERIAAELWYNDLSY